MRNINNSINIDNQNRIHPFYIVYIGVKIDGLSIDKLYENFMQQIVGDALQSEEGKVESLKESVERDSRRQELEKQIAVLQTKVRKEKQLNKQVKLNTELKKLRKELEELK